MVLTLIKHLLIGAMLSHLSLLALAPTADAMPAQAKERISKAFKKADANRDGALTLAEAKAGIPARLWKNFQRIDADKSGTITMAEIEKAFDAKALK
jgi:Ca2+-binding EF-hand superfamily protein